jgi:hypothetical protein
LKNGRCSEARYSRLQAQGIPFQEPTVPRALLSLPFADGFEKEGANLLNACAHSVAVVIAVPGKHGPFTREYLRFWLTSANPEPLVNTFGDIWGLVAVSFSSFSAFVVSSGGSNPLGQKEEFTVVFTPSRDGRRSSKGSSLNGA